MMGKKSKITIWVEQRSGGITVPSHDAHEYVVTKAQNTTEVHIGQTLSKTKIDLFVTAGWTVNIG